MAIGAAAAGAAVKFTREAAQLDTQMREVVTLFGETGRAADRSLGVVRTQVRELSNEFGVAQEELTGGLYSAISAGVPKDNAFEFMRVASQAAIGGVTDVETAVDGISTAVNAFGLKATDARSVADSLFTAVKGGKTTFSELSDSLFNIAPSAAAAGVSLQEVNAGIAALTAGGTPTSVATTQLRAALTGLQAPSAELDGIFQDLGFRNAQLAVESKGLGFALDAVKDASKGNNGELQKLLGSSEAVAAANVLAGTGARKFTDELRAQRDAAGAAGKAFETVNAGAERSYERLTTKLRNAGVQIGQAILPFALEGVEALERQLGPALDGAADRLADLSSAFEVDGVDGLVREIDDLIGAGGNLSPILDEITDAGDGVYRAFKVLAGGAVEAFDGVSPLLSPLKLVGDIAQVTATALEALPDELVSLGVQAGAASLILPRLTGAATNAGTQFAIATAKARQFRAELSYGVTRADALQRGLTQLGGAARAAGGIGGMLALSAGAADADSKTGFLLSTIGGAATGFAVGGPIGAILGGGAGAAMATFAAKTDDAATSSDQAKRPVTDFAESLDQVTGAATAATGELIRLELQQSGAFKAGRELGLSTRDLIQFMGGNERAIRRVNDALTSYQGATRVVINPNTGVAQTFYDGAEAVGELSAALGTTSEALEKNGRQVRQRAREVQDFSRLTGLVPKRVVSRLDLNGVKPTVDGIASVVSRFRLVDRKQIKALIAVTGVDTSVRDVRKVSDSLRGVSRTIPDFTGYQRSFKSGVQAVEGEAQRGTADVSRKLRDGTKGAKADTGAWKQSLVDAISQGRVTAGDSRGIGAQFSLGTASGIAANSGAVESAARAVIQRALAAARAEARIKSPSQRARDEIGKQIGLGIAVGMDATKKRTEKAGRDLITAALSGVTGGSSGISKALDRVTGLIGKTFDQQLRAQEKRLRGTLKGDRLDKALRDAARESRTDEKSALKALRDQYDALERNGKAQDRIGRSLDSALGKYRQLVSEARAYADQVKSGFVSFGSVVGLGQNEDGSVSVATLLDQLRDRASQSERFASLIRQFRDNQGPKLNETSVQQLLDAGVEGGLATAEALAAGGAAAVNQVNSLTSQIAQSGTGLGAAMVKEFKQAGIDAAEGLVKGLQARERQLDRVADRLAKRLASSVKDALGIKSPSRVFAEIGGNVVRGLDIGLDETYVKRSGANLSKALTAGYGRPQLDAGVLGGRSNMPTFRVELNLTADQVTDLQRGRAVRVQGDAVGAVGYRTVAR